ncbi:MAG: endonuclease [Deltaproteobacteria bacterium]|nr:endonuclease [Deltaproteobacteria bacterium]
MDPDDTVAFAEKVLALLQQGSFTATYKYAVLIGLIDLSLEGYTAAGLPPESITTPQLAEVVVRLYWPQVAPFEAIDGGVLRQNTRGQAEIVRLVAQARAHLGGGGGAPIERVRRQAPKEYQRLIRDVEWKLVEMPLPRLQEFPNGPDRFIYEIAWDRDVTRGEFNDATRFPNVIRFRPGVAAHLIRLDGLLRPLLYRAWAMQVAAINRLPETRLETHLFGVDRTALRPVLTGLAELQQGRCFYCDGRLRSPEVDHFLPWARVSLDAIENLVVADEACNGQKTDHLAASAHVRRWRERLEAQDRLREIADHASWETSPARTLGVARALYLPLTAGARLWSRADGLVPADPVQLRALLTA